MEEVKNDINEETGKLYDEVLKTYKSGYLDGMIVGLHAAYITEETIVKYLGTDLDYVKQEIEAYKENIKKAEGKISEFVPLEWINDNDI